MAAGEQVALQPALAGGLAEDLHHSAIGREVHIVLVCLGHPRAVGHLEDGVEAIRRGLIGSNDTEVRLIAILGHHIAQEGAEHARRLRVHLSGAGDFDAVLREVGHLEVVQEQASVGVRIEAHLPVALRRQFEKLRLRPPLLVEEFLGPVALHPLLEDLKVLRLVAHLFHRDLVRAPVALDLLAVNLLRTGPALGSPQHDHRPERALFGAALPRLALNGVDAVDDAIHRGGHLLVNVLGVISLDDPRLVAVADHQVMQFIVRNPRQNGRVGDLVAVEVQDRQHGAVSRRIEELVRVPRRGERPGLGLAIADDAGDDQVRIVERRAVGMRE